MTATNTAAADAAFIAALAAPPVFTVHPPLTLDPAPRAEDAGRLTLDQALAELAAKPAPVLAAEARHGFTFGGPTPAGPGRATAAVVCVAAGCTHSGRHVQVHDDTVAPVHCGGCGGVLHCDHAPEITRHREGTLGAPVEVTLTRCTRCRLELGKVARPLPPINLAELPASILEQPVR